jgi:hypothetical protein
VRAPVEAAAPAVARRAEESWKPWYGGGYQSLSADEYRQRTGRAPEKGAVTYELAPTGVGLKVTEHLKGETGRDGYRARIRLDGDARGPAEVRLERRGGGESALVGEFQGVTPGGLGKLLGPATFGVLHLGAEGATRALPKTGIGLTEDRGFHRLARELEKDSNRR